MTIQFNIDYQTSYGEELVLNILGADALQTYRMATLDGTRWFYTLSLEQPADVLTYYYSVSKNALSAKSEWTLVPHRLELSATKAKAYTVYDRWNAIPEDSYLYSSAFTDCINHQQPTTVGKTSYGKTVRLIVRAPQLRDGDRLTLVGADQALGQWKESHALPMTQHAYNEWLIDIDYDRLSSRHMEFKFVVQDEGRKETMWETCHNRTVDLPDLGEGQIVVYQLDQSFFSLWNRKLAGTLVPVFSLRSKRSAGVGDFGDLVQMIDLVAKTGQKVLQLLPINDTTITHTWTDSYPYSCISIFALHPQYADLRALPALKDEAAQGEAEQTMAELNALPQIDYERVNDFKTSYLRQIFQQEGDKTMKSAAYKAFFKETEQWLVPYAQYCALRDKYGTADFSQWPDHNQWDEADRKDLCNTRCKAYREVAFYYYVQYILNTQMKAAHEHAKEKGVILKGDIPIGVNRYGCDVWMEPKYFNLNGQAGAPPDDFSVNGQNWGFPTYNWDAMLADDCAWWVRRFQNMANFFDAYRIDHVLGFFRIWEIPVSSVHGLLGQFSPSLAMSREEIEGYGLNFQEERFTEPFITDWTLERIFHEDALWVKENFLDCIDDERYKMKPEYDTQRKIEAWYSLEERGEWREEREMQDNLSLSSHKPENKEPESNSLSSLHSPLSSIRDGLYALISDVLFVRDRKNPELFHPRISAQLDFIYESLYDNDKQAFNRLYNDYFYRRNNQFWYREAMKKLPKLVQATRMLVCAEDLGMVPDCVPWVMSELKILSLELQSMPKDPTVRFGHLSRNPYRSVSTISSHDMPTLRQWWDEDQERTQAYYNTMLYREGGAPHPLPGWLAKDIISRHLTSPSMLCVLSIQDWLAIDEHLRLADANAERINIPANPKHYWRYRMHTSIEDLAQSKEFTDTLSEMFRQSGRI